MSRIWQKDGLSREQRIRNTELSRNISLLNDDFHSLSQKAFGVSTQINYYNLSNQIEGTLNQLFEKSVFFTITYLRNIDIRKEEQDFLYLLENNFYTGLQKEEKIITRLLDYANLFDGWIRSTSYFEACGYKLYFITDLVNQTVANLLNPVAALLEYCKQKHFNIVLPELGNIWTPTGKTQEISDASRFYKSTFYRFQNSIGTLQNHIDLYEKEVAESGYVDPSIGLLAAFFTNHNKIASGFNNRWKQYPDFYFDQILEAAPAKAVPDSTYLKINKAASVKYLLIPEDTIFKTASEIKFRSIDEYVVSGISLKKAFCLYEETAPEIEPNNELGYATALHKYDQTDLIDRQVSGNSKAKLLFGPKTEKTSGSEIKTTSYTPVGLLLKSWSFLLREGERDLFLRFIPSMVSLKNFSQLVDTISEKLEFQEQETIYKLLHDIFYIEISTEEGWKQVRSSSVEIAQEKTETALLVSLHFSETFPAICSLPDENEPFSPPSIRIMVNHNTWMFPYSWLKMMEFVRIKIDSKVRNLSNVQIYSELGKLDTSMPFYPFGVIPRKGSWMALGSYEMSVKKITGMNLHIRWSDLPDDDYGFAGYYGEYQKDIDNGSFQVVPQLLKNRKWAQIADNTSYSLFNTGIREDKAETAPKAKLINESFLGNITPQEFVPSIQKEEEYYFNMFSRTGFFRLVLTNPSMGFGHSQYQKIISDVLMQKARSKGVVQMPNLPYAPQMEHVLIDYCSEDEMVLDDDTPNGNQIFHIHPFGLTLLNNSSGTQKFNFIPSLSGQGNLLLGFDGIEGGETIRLFVDMQPQEKEIERDQAPGIKWFYGDGFNWNALPSHSLVSDETRSFLVTGIIEISIPGDIPDRSGAMEKLFWLRVSVEKNINNISEISGIHLHVTKVERILPNDLSDLFELVPALSITEPEQKIPGLEEIIQLKKSSGGRMPENRRMMQIRLAERISHRNRAINARDYERLILENFPAVQKAKCFPGIDSKSNRAGVVTIAVIEKNLENPQYRTPKSNCQLLLEIEDFLKKYTGIFTTIDLINPVYEFLQVHCKVTLSKNLSEGYYLQKLNEEINQYIAFWEANDDVPVFGYSVSVIELANFIRCRDYVDHITNFSLIHLSEERENYYEMKELDEFESVTGKTDDMTKTIRVLVNDEEVQAKVLEPVRPSKPWGILVPVDTHRLAAYWEDQNEKVGIDELEIGNTFVIQ